MNSGSAVVRRLLATILAAAFAAAAPGPAFAQGGDASAEHEAHHHEPVPALPSSDVLGDILVDFSLVDGDGRIMSDEDFRGRYMLMGYGFTRCTDVCPLMAANMAMAGWLPSITAIFSGTSSCSAMRICCAISWDGTDRRVNWSGPWTWIR